jgi:hypothetical protein
MMLPFKIFLVVKKMVVAKPPPMNVFTLLVDAFWMNFLSKNLQSSLINLKISVRNIYKCIVTFHFLHTIRAFFRQDFLNKNLQSNLIRSKISVRTIYNKNLPFCFGLKFCAYSGRFSASPFSAKLNCQSVKTCRCCYARSSF